MAGIIDDGSSHSITGWFGNLTKPGTGNNETRADLHQSGNLASDFADLGQANYGQLGAEGAANREYLRQLAMGQHSVTAEQLRQGLQQQLAQQRAMAAGASPNNAAMAARNAAMNMGRASYGMSGQQALAGLAERNQAQNNLTGAINAARQQDLQAALQSRQNAISGYGATLDPNKDKSTLEQYAPYINAGASLGGIVAKSDRRAKTDIKDADSKTRKMLDGLKAYTFKYKNGKDGEGEQYGIMAQELEKHGLKHAVMDTPDGKVVHGAKLATANTAMIAALGRRVSQMESERK